jgi:uncharacterized protein YbcV (DUF1398 family)
MNAERSKNLAPQTRNAWGLIEGIDYKTNEDGSINWRAMVKSEHLFPNKGWFEARKQPLPSSVEGLADNQLLIKLAGIKELAKLRGYTSVKYDIIKCESSYVAVKCGITWMPNYESEYESYYEDVANATVNNTSDFAVKFLETIAANRAFVRAVRNFLNVHIVGSDEIDASKKGTPAIFEDDNEVALPSSQGMLEKTAKNSGITSFTEFQEYLRKAWKLGVYKNEEAKVWGCYNDIPAKEARILMSILKDK